MGRRSWPSLGRHLVLRFRLHRRAQARSQLFGIPSAETVGRGSRASPLVWAHHPDSRFQKTLIVDAATNTSMGTWMRPCSLSGNMARAFWGSWWGSSVGLAWAGHSDSSDPTLSFPAIRKSSSLSLQLLGCSPTNNPNPKLPPDSRITLPHHTHPISPVASWCMKDRRLQRSVRIATPTLII